MTEPSLSVDQHLLEWIRERVAETAESGSIYLSIEKRRLTWINYERDSQFLGSNRPSSSGGPQSCSASEG